MKREENCIKRRAVTICLFLLAIHVPGLEILGQSKLILPPEYEGKAGGNIFSGFLVFPGEYQSGYADTLFEGAEADQIEITGIAFRLDPVSPSVDVLIPRLEIWASTYKKPLGEMFPGPARNWGEDRKLLFTGENVRLTGQQDAQLELFPVEVLFQESFFYDRKAGHLLLDYIATGSYAGSRGAYTDPASYADPSKVRTVYSDRQLFSMAEIVRISYVPIPEPTTTLILLLGIVTGITYRLNRGRL